jgi:hypothetical protein
VISLGMVTTPTPSTLLARSLAVMEQILAGMPEQQEELRDIADSARHSHEAVWELEAGDLFEIGGLNPDAALQSETPQHLARGIGILDAWHRFANPGLVDFADAQPPADAVTAEGRLESTGQFNDSMDLQDGLLIPAICSDAVGANFTDRLPLRAEYKAYLDVYKFGKAQDELPDSSLFVGANQLLKNTTWLPSKIICDYTGPSGPLPQTVATCYTQIGQMYKPAPLSSSTELRVAVVPLAETRECVHVVVTDSGSRYLVAPAFSIERVKAAIAKAFIDGAHVLLFPEMTIDCDWIPELANAVCDARRSERRSPLRYIILGTTRRPRDGVIGENFICVIDGSGKPIASRAPGGLVRQDKISRWDLEIRDQRRFGFDRGRASGSPLAAIVRENIQEADTVFVFDILGFGRLICLICASLNQNQPSDWLIAHGHPDWVYAPVMDSSTCWSSSRSSPLEKWTVRRAVRAACLSRGKVMVSNSMALQEFENEELRYPDNPDMSPKKGPKHHPNSRPGVALMVDGSGPKLRYQLLRADIPSQVDDKAPTFAATHWNRDWEPLPVSI